MKHYLLAIITLFFPLTSYAAECPRIISQSPYITQSLQWLGLEKCIVGVSRYDSLDLPHTGGILDPDKEAMDSLMPDLIFTSNWISEEKMQQATPEGAKSYRLNGFYSMQEIENNLLTMGQAAGIGNIKQQVSDFNKNWRQAIKQIDARGKKALLLSSCSNTPYSFGKKTWLYDLFNQAGFKLVETHKRIRHLKKGNEIEEINDLLNHFKPELLFIFERKLNKQCKLILPKTPVQIVTLDGKHFLHPAPILLKGLKALQTKQAQWH